jgi:putative IMPACT (imprinted ancient) family translation regulator
MGDDPAAREELESLRAIFGADELEADADGRTLRFSLPPGVRVLIRLPHGYPSKTAEPPEVEVSGLPRGRGGAGLEAALAAAVERAHGGPCVFDIVSSAREYALSVLGSDGAGGGSGGGGGGGIGGPGDSSLLEADDDAAAAAEEALAARAAREFAAGAEEAVQVAFSRGAPIVERKSVFVAHAARVTSADDVRRALAALLSEPRIARATHNIRAHRFRDAAGALHADNDDDGEDAAGGRLAELLQMMGVEDVLVVVTRWYGGVLLGPLRFKCINNAARSLLEELPWTAPARPAAAAASRGKR